MGAPWFRFYSETLGDRKIDFICRTTGRPKALIIGVWATILALANDSPIRGALLLTEEIPLTCDDLVLHTGLSREEMEELLDEFQRLGMVEMVDFVFHVSNWGKRQFSSDCSTDRVREWRERNKDDDDSGEEEEEGNDETPESGSGETLQEQPGNVAVTAQIAETETKAESEEESPEGANAPSTPAKKPRKRTSKPKEPSPTKQASQEMFSALAELCQIDWRACTSEQRNALNQSEKLLRTKLEASPADLKTFAGWWYANDWRGRGSNGGPPSPPRPHQVRETWGQFTAWRKNGKKVSYGHNRPNNQTPVKPPAAPVDPAQVERDRAALRDHRAKQRAAAGAS